MPDSDLLDDAFEEVEDYIEFDEEIPGADEDVLDFPQEEECGRMRIWITEILFTRM